MRSLVVLGVAAAISAAGLWLRGSLPVVNATHRTAQVSRHLTLIPDRLVYGMTRQQVEQRIGRPEKVAGNCWQYREGVKNFVGQTIDAVRVCFFDGIYSTSYYQQIDGLWRDPSGSRHVIPPPTQ